MLKECFVAQCFDGGIYDRRYRETFAPAIQDAGATPVRADEVVGTTPVIEKIESALKRSAIAFAEVSEDNPNVFLEVGYAIALGTPIVIVCDKNKRSTLPFDIQHRPIIFYSTHAQSDFEKLKENITKNVKVALTEATEQRSLENVDTSPSPEQVDNVKRLCLLQLLDEDMRSPEGSSLWELQKSIRGADISDRMIALAVTSLINEDLVEINDRTDENGQQYRMIFLSTGGQKLILREYSALMKEESIRLKNQQSVNWGKDADLDDEVPF